MKLNKVLMDPTAELAPVERERLPRPDSLVDKMVGLLDISKARGEVFLARLGELMAADGISVRHYKKPTFARVAPLELLQQMSVEVDLVVEGLAD
jgi:hypothetical protein